jgi:hypothetical protein
MQPSPDSVKPLDPTFWRFKVRSPYRRVVYVEWDMWHSHHMVGDLTEVLGPDFLATIIAGLPALMSKAIPVSHALTGVLVERAPHIAQAFRVASSKGLLGRSMHGVYATQGEPGAEIFVPLEYLLTDPKAVPTGQTPPTGVFKGGPFDLYNVAIGVLLENLFPLEDGEHALRQTAPQAQSPSPHQDTETPSPDPLDKVANKGMALPAVQHVMAWVKTRGD